MGIEINPEEIKANVNKTIDSLACLKTTTPLIDIKFTKNKLDCLTKLEKSGRDLKRIVDSYTDKYQKNLADLTKGVMIMEELDSCLSSAIKSEEESIKQANTHNKKNRESGFYIR